MIIGRTWVYLTLIGTVIWAEQNPFLCQIPNQKNWTHQDWLTLQQNLRTIDLAPLLQQMYPQDQGYTTFEDFLQRCSRGIRQTFIDPERGLFPQTMLEKIGAGSDLCIVSYASYDGLYPEFIQANVIALEAVGFNGYYLYAIGDFPSSFEEATSGPSHKFLPLGLRQSPGIEIDREGGSIEAIPPPSLSTQSRELSRESQCKEFTGKTTSFAGVPYSFKMGMMLEAKKLGFTKVLWLDSAVMPLRDPKSLFDRLEKNGALLLHKAAYSTLWRYIFPSTLQLLTEVTGTDVLQARHVWGAIFGLHLDTPEASSFIDLYYQCVMLGFPFISCFPEQFVFSAIIGQEKYKKWFEDSSLDLLNLDCLNGIDPRAEIEDLKKSGFYFYLRRH